ncbi:MAG: 50S ribosomal protein L25 [Clostridiales bacterium]
MAEIVLNANVREISRKSANKQLRKNGYVPGVFYSKSQKPIAIEVAEKALKPLVFTSEAHIVSLKVGDNDALTCVIKDVQFDPVTDRIVHFDLLGITTGEKIEIEVPVLLVGNAAGVKQGGIIQQVLHKVDIECLPTEMPEHIQVDVSKLLLGESLHVRDLKFDNINFLTAPESVVVSVVSPRAEKEASEAPAEPEVITKGKTEKGEE